MEPSVLITGVHVLALAMVAHSTENTCSNCGVCCCVAGNMQVEEQSRGIIRVSQLFNGDFIRGISGADRKPGWCKVEAVYPSTDDTVDTYGGFTAGLMVVDDDFVHQFGKKRKAKQNVPYQLATECDAALNAAGQAFTPISTAFCPHDLSWNVFPNMGGDVSKEEAGTITETVRPKGMRSIMITVAVGGARAGFLLVVLIAVVLYHKKCRRGNKKMQDLQANHPQVNTDNAKA
ncbi:hypothetical protein AWC38_SpisGene24616 [Stylophora pistillata]|uniref:Uncharacterized protein n=1 Tax=Stylophora pistillata TaxID=50429 RepID=A0A2B4R467_STYPI|nr:hypothetical protein AWC38_SpisGene24616 [Stylophora pistillata]